MTNDAFPASPQRIELSGRESLTVSGVEDVERFDETEIVMNTSLGVLVVTGDSLHIGKLSLDGGELHVDGRIDAIAFEDAPIGRGGFLARLFGGRGRGRFALRSGAGLFRRAAARRFALAALRPAARRAAAAGGKAAFDRRARRALLRACRASHLSLRAARRRGRAAALYALCRPARRGVLFCPLRAAAAPALGLLGRGTVRCFPSFCSPAAAAAKSLW